MLVITAKVIDYVIQTTSLLRKGYVRTYFFVISLIITSLLIKNVTHVVTN